MAAVELFDTDPGATRLGHPGERVRRFDVDVHQKSALADPAVPKEKDVHPNFPDLFCISRDVEVSGGFTGDVPHSIVTCRYAQHPLAQTKGGSFLTESVEIPTVFERFIKPQGAPAGTPKQRVQDVDALKIVEGRTVLQITCKIEQFGTQEQATLANQHNVIHLVGNRPLRCEIGDVVPVEPKLWEVTYSWYSDPGTPPLQLTWENPATGLWELNPNNPVVTGPVGNQTGLYYPPTIPPGQNPLRLVVPGFNDFKAYCRAPFHEVDVILHPVVEPVFTQFFPYRVDVNGWQSLPGGPQP